jgi:N-acetylglucosamine-6-phosphate deacetylase
VSLGHSDARAAEVEAAIAAGAGAFTHLFNAMSQMTGREPGVVGAAIASEVPCGIICDGHHVADSMIALACRARPVPDAMFLVSDAMPTVGGPDRFALYDQEVAVVDGRLVNAEGALAGAHLCMAWAVTRMIRTVGVAPEEALRMAVTVPAGLIGRPDLATLADRDAADVLVLTPEWSMQGRLADLAPRTPDP